MSGKVKISPRCRARQWTTFRDAEGRTLSVRLLDGMTASRLARAGVCRAARPETAFHRRRPTLPSTRVPTKLFFEDDVAIHRGVWAVTNHLIPRT